MKKLFLLISVLSIVFLEMTGTADDFGSIEGIIFEKGTKRAVPDAPIYALPSKQKATTDGNGKFRFEKLEVGEMQLVINLPNFHRYDGFVKVELGTPQSLTIYLEKQNYLEMHETVLDKTKKRDDTTRTLKTQDFMAVPGANGDPIKAVQNLPGVSRTNGFSSQVLIQGSSSQDTSYLLDEHSVPLIFHFGGFTSILTPESIDQVDYMSAGYGPEYGRAMGGLIGLRTRQPDRKQKKGYLFTDLTKAGGLLEGPIDETSSYLISGRYSYLSLVLKQVFKNSPRFDLTVAPAFSDASFIYSKKMNALDDLKVVLIGSRDELKFVLNEPLREQPSVRGSFLNETSFYRIIPQWTHRYEMGTLGKFSLGLGEDTLNLDIGENFLKVKSLSLTHRMEWEMKPSTNWKTSFGMDNRVSRDEVNFALPVIVNTGGVGQPSGSREKVLANITGTPFVVGAFWRNEYKLEETKWTLMPHLRMDYLNVTKEALVQPRVAVRYDQDSSLFYRGTVGLYSQAPQPQELASSYGNPDLKSPSAIHYTLGLDKDFRDGSSEGWRIQSTLFYKNFQNLVISSSEKKSDGSPERFSNSGRGRAQGLEVLVKLDEGPWSNLLSYTFSQSYRWTPTQGEYLFSSDQTHNVNLVSSIKLPRNWILAARLRFVTGNPFTPVKASVFDSDNDVYFPISGPFYSERNEPFFQMDLRADKKWIYDEWILWGYLDIQNVTNRMNSEGVRYSYDYSIKTNVTGLPIIPILGLRGEF